MQEITFATKLTINPNDLIPSTRNSRNENTERIGIFIQNFKLAEYTRTKKGWSGRKWGKGV